MDPGSGTRVESLLVRAHDVLACFTDTGGVTEELDLHLLSLAIRHEPLVRQLLADGLTALGLFLATRPVDEQIGWTISLQRPTLMNLFFTGESERGSVVGRVYLEHVKEGPDNLFICQSARSFGEPALSTVAVDGIDIYGMVETYFCQSEQRQGRYFHRDGKVALLVSLPRADEDWLAAVTVDEVFDLPGSADVVAMGERHYGFRCGCNRERIITVLQRTYGEDVDELFAGEPVVTVECPRCAATLQVSREDYEAGSP